MARRRGEKKFELSEYRGVWLFVMFDLPVDSAAARREYTRFRKSLVAEGFMQVQYSVYARYYRSEDRSDAQRGKIRSALPPEGEVRLMHITDKQWGMMERFLGPQRKKPEEPPPQLVLF